MFVWCFRFAFLCLGVICLRAQDVAPPGKDNPHVQATLSLTSGATQYRQGELIEITMSFTSDRPGQFNAFSRPDNRWGTPIRDEVHVFPAKNAVDPLAAYEHPFLSNVRDFSPSGFLSLPGPLPAKVTLPLTDWIRFSTPGHYSLFLRTFRVSATADAAPLTLDTNKVELDILPADAAWRARQLNEINAEIAARQPVPWTRLRALGTPDAARLLVRQYRADFTPLDQDAILGLLGSPNKKAATDEMRRLVQDPDFPVAPSFLDALALLELPPSKAGWSAIHESLPPLREQLLQALQTKRGPALATSRQTYIAGLEQLAAVRFSPDVIMQLQQVIEKLPPLDQGLWLGQRWTQVSDPSWLPVLRRLALRDVKTPGYGNPEMDPNLAMSALALKRWYELDPQTGREAILREVVNPIPGFGAEALGILPDRTLPAEQHVIAQNFASLALPVPPTPTRANVRYRYMYQHIYEAAASHLESLLLRYADREVLPEFLPVFRERLTQMNCSARLMGIAFLLKVEPDEADRLLPTAGSEGPPGHSPCAGTMFSDIGHVIGGPVLERFAIASLDDSDLTVATDALRYLRDHGSAQAEQPIFERLVRWNAERAQAEREFGRELAQTLAIGHGWLADKTRIRQVFSLALDSSVGGEMEAYMSQLESKPIHIYSMGSVGPMFLVAQYRLESVDDLKNKLSQYPPGTVFAWADRRTPDYDILDSKVSAEVGQWGTLKGIHIEGL